MPIHSPLATLQNLNLYLDAGTQDEFQFNINAENFVETLFDRSLVFRVENGFPEDFPSVSHFNEKRVYVRYPGGHVGFNKENIGLSFEQAKQGIEEAIVVANRFTTLFSFISDHFTGGDFGTNPLELLLYPSKMEVAYFTSSSLNRTMKFGIYLPPGYSRSRTNYYPVLYFLLGYNMSVDGMTNSWIKAVLDGLILTGEMQKMIIVIPDGLNYKNQNGKRDTFSSTRSTKNEETNSRTISSIWSRLSTPTTKRNRPPDPFQRSRVVLRAYDNSRDSASKMRIKWC